jgi:hypothetical protein
MTGGLLVNDEHRLQLARFFDGELPAEERDRVERELATDPAASRYLEQLRLLRHLADRRDPSSIQCSANLLVVRPWQRAAAARQRARQLAWVAAAAAAILGFVWCSKSLAPRNRSPAMASPDTHARDSSKSIESRVPDFTVSPGLPAVSPSLELDAQCFAWANGELMSPASAARVLLDARPRHGARSSNAEVLAIELAHTPPNSSQEVARTLIERSVSIRLAPSLPKAGHKPPAATPATPQGLLPERGQVHSCHSPLAAIGDGLRASGAKPTLLSELPYAIRTCQVGLASLWPGAIL